MMLSRLFLALFLIMAAFCATAQPVVLPFDSSYPPMSFRTPQGQADGFDVAVAREISARMAIDVVFEPSDFFDIQSGQWPDDWGFAVASMSRDAERDKVFEFIGPYLFETVVVVASANAPAIAVADLQNIRIGICSGCVYKAYLEGNYEGGGSSGPPIPGAEPVFFATDSDILRKLSSASADLQYGITSAFHADYFIGLGAGIRKLDPPLYVSPLWIAVPKRHQALLQQLEPAFQSIVADGTLSALSTTYLTSDYTTLPGSD